MADWKSDLRRRDERIARRIAELRAARAEWEKSRLVGAEMARAIVAQMNAHGR